MSTPFLTAATMRTRSSASFLTVTATIRWTGSGAFLASTTLAIPVRLLMTLQLLVRQILNSLDLGTRWNNVVGIQDILYRLLLLRENLAVRVLLSPYLVALDVLGTFVWIATSLVALVAFPLIAS